MVQSLASQKGRYVRISIKKCDGCDGVEGTRSNIDVSEATKRGIIVGNTPGVLTETTADFAWSLLMAAGRRVAEGDRWTRSGRWKTWGPMILLGYDIHHATLGIIGCGRIGLEMARRAKGFNMKVLYYDEFRRKPEEEKE